ncbi:class E sortase [Agromyces aurantiacus]|uniref:Class E sortase n=1 Tax=Agromyces aurantiacus TaxID=165814 RepID=A0ABV9R448_9MICO|nr:class E sortase [Agromyces aurantiacus]MBM7502912.1 sortase A [Agromyces aurantiacus]
MPGREPAEPAERDAVASRGVQAPARRRVGPVAVLGEVLLSAGALILLFLGWKLWWNDALVASQQSDAASDLSTEWIEQDRTPGTHDGEPTPPAESPDPGPPVVDGTDYGNGDAFAVMYVPRFGEDSQRTIAEGIGLDVLSSFDLGVGHYPGTQMPGEVGNFAIAAHRSAYGGGMHEIEQLQLGDAIYIQTRDGWYTYRFRDLEYVTPESVEVLAPVPHHPDLEPTDRIVTLTSCNPLYSTAERIIAYGVLESWQPAAAGPPADIAAQVAAWGE